jgi:hypothetical protein
MPTFGDDVYDWRVEQLVEWLQQASKQGYDSRIKTIFLSWQNYSCRLQAVLD